MLIGLRTRASRHVADYVRRLPAQFNEQGETIPLCGTYLDPRTTKRQRIERISPAVICPDCVMVARRWYADHHFTPWDSVQRQRLLAAIEWDLEAVA